MAKKRTEIGRWSKATGVTRPILGQKEWEELWVGDVIACRVYITDRVGVYLSVEGVVVWDREYAMYVIDGTYTDDNKQYRNTFPLHKIVREDFRFIIKKPRGYGSQRDVILGIVKSLKSHSETVSSCDQIIEDIVNMGIVPEDEIRQAFSGSK